jgi:uncharacterized protein DUF3516
LFRVLVRNALFRRVELAALRRWDLLGELDAEAGWDADAWRAALEPYFAEYGRDDGDLTAIGTGPAARGPALVSIIEEPRPPRPRANGTLVQAHWPRVPFAQRADRRPACP